MQPVEVVPAPAGLPTHLPLWRIVLVLAWWPLLEQVMGAMVGSVDTALAGRLQPEATEAIGTAGYVLWLMGMLQGAVGVGGTALIARAVGAGDYRHADRVLGQAVLVALAWGAINIAMFWFLAPVVGRLSSFEGEALALCTMYLRLLALAAPCRAVLFIGAACLRGAGDTKSPFFVMLLVNVVNVIVSVLLVADFSPIGGWGMRGIATGTVFAWGVGIAAMSALLLRGRFGIRLHRADSRFDAAVAGRLLRIGVPSLIENVGHWSGNLIVIVMVGMLAKLGLNEAPMGSQIIAIRIEAFSFLSGFAFSIAASTMVGQYLGAGDRRRARHAAWIAWAYAAAVMVTLGVLLMVIPETLTRIFTDKQPFLTDVPRMVFHAGWAQIGFATYLVLSGALRGAGDTRSTMAMTFASTFLVRLPAAYVLGLWLAWGLVGIWIALAGELVFRGLLFLAWFLRGRWAEKQV